MHWRIKIGRAAGIDVFLHWSFFLVPLYVVLLPWQSGMSWPVVGILSVLLSAVFGCVLLHEFGHALAARYFGVETRDIIITPIGGLARLKGIPTEPQHEFAIAIAGPVVNLVIAIGFALALIITGKELWPNPTADGLLQFPQLMLWVNLFLFFFNLIPAFPMDGGRILRSLLATSFKHSTATLIAGVLGQFVALGFIGYGIFYANYQLALIGVFVFVTAGAEIAFRNERSPARSQVDDNSPE